MSKLSWTFSKLLGPYYISIIYFYRGILFAVFLTLVKRIWRSKIYFGASRWRSWKFTLFCGLVHGNFLSWFEFEPRNILIFSATFTFNILIKYIHTKIIVLISMLRRKDKHTRLAFRRRVKRWLLRPMPLMTSSH